MKRTIVLLLIISSIFITQQTIAQDPPADYRFGIGIRLSNSTPTLNNSITGKYFITNKSAVEGLISFGSRFGIGAMLEIYQPFSTPGLRWFYGAGGYVGFESDPGKTFAGPTGILGLDYKFPNVPVNLSVDWKPELDIIPDINFIPDAFALSVRFTLGGQR